MVLSEVRYWELVESYGLQTLCECHERCCGCSADLSTGEIYSGEDDSWYGQRRGGEKLEKLRRKLNGPKNTAKHMEAKQNWINRESKRIESIPTENESERE